MQNDDLTEKSEALQTNGKLEINKIYIKMFGSIYNNAKKIYKTW